MMLSRFLYILSVYFSLLACSSEQPEIQTVCTRDDIGNYIVKWEVTPALEGVVKMYVSDDPDEFDFTQPVGTYPISDGVATYITHDNFNRKFFCLTFNDEYPQVVASRFVAMDEMQNFRDLGGYQTEEHRRVRWGKVFRSGTITPYTEWDSIRFSIVRVKTIIDLRPEEDARQTPISYKKAQLVSIPISLGNQSELDRRIEHNRMRKGDGLLYMQDLYLQFVSDDTAKFAEALDVFTHEENYPIVFCSLLGKDQAGFLAALLLSALDVPRETVLRDYVASNQYIDPLHFQERVEHLSPDTQEAVTVLVSARESFLELAFRKIEKDYGSVDKYLRNELGLTDAKKNELRRLLLY